MYLTILVRVCSCIGMYSCRLAFLNRDCSLVRCVFSNVCIYWFAGFNPLWKNISQFGMIVPNIYNIIYIYIIIYIYGKIKNVPNHQPVYVQTKAGTSFKVVWQPPDSVDGDPQWMAPLIKIGETLQTFVDMVKTITRPLQNLTKT